MPPPIPMRTVAATSAVVEMRSTIYDHEEEADNVDDGTEGNQGLVVLGLSS
jgi:hypothetical protein